MESFQWNDNFVTGLVHVDQQHHHLVDMVNQLGSLLMEDKFELDPIEEIYQELADYSVYHFKEEEALMKQVGLDKRHIEHHIESHQGFLGEVVTLHANLSADNPQSIKHLLDFLTHWLAYHILGSDQNMARQIGYIRDGGNPEEAYNREEKEANSATEALLAALNGLFNQVSARNNELTKLNQSLEENVNQRTKELSDANRRLKELSLTDTLTGLPNRRHAMQRLASLWEESIKSGAPLLCMMIDADHFKEVNDNCGHDTGDIVLIELAKTLKDTFRTDDIVCRIGGDEFLVICPATKYEGGMQAAENVRKKVSELRVQTCAKPWHGSISVGVASRTAEIKSYQELIKIADKAVYSAKQDGKNCIRTVG